MRPSLRRSVATVVAFTALLGGCGGGNDSPSKPAGTGGSAPVDLGPPEVDDDLPLARAEGLAPTPPMGWNSWNSFAANVTAADIRAAADLIVSSGMKDAGYEYVNIDDGWAGTMRDADGTVEVDPDFSDGIAALADYVHGQGLKLGIYSDRGTQTCGHRVGSQDHTELDAQTYASWGVDYVKYDNCSADETGDVKETQYRDMRTALDATGRPIVYSICAWKFYEWSIGMGQLWRTTSDITASFGDEKTEHSVLGIARANSALAAYAGPNSWNDADMLEVGRFTTSLGDAESRSHFSLWSIMAAPLIAGNDLSQMTDATREILTNQDVIDVDQDYLGIQGVPVKVDGDLTVWSKPLNESGARAVAIVNRGTNDLASTTFDWSAIGLRRGNASVYDLWHHADLGTVTDSYSVTVPTHDVVMLKIRGSEPTHPKGSVNLGDFPWVYAANGLGPVERNQSNGASAAGDGGAISLGGTTFASGLGMSAPAAVIYRLAKNCTGFSATVGVDDLTAGNGSVQFRVIADDELLFDSGRMTGSDAPQDIDVSVEGKRRLKLLVTNGSDPPDQDPTSWDRASWGDARLDCGAD